MSSDPQPLSSTPDVEYARIWCDCTARVLESLHGSPVTGTPKAAPSESEAIAEDQSLWIRFKVTGRLEGEHAFQIARSDGVRLAQLLMSEPADATVAYNDTHADAINEIFRQFAGLAATSCKSKYAGEVQFQLADLNRPGWTPACKVLGIFAGPQLEPLQWSLSISRELYAVIGVLEAAGEGKVVQPLQRAQTPSAKPAPAPATEVLMPAPQPAMAEPVVLAPPALSNAPRSTAATSITTPANLNLLLDIELDARLRFGQCEMILREILELRPGSVVELNRQILEPAELLVAGRVIARGEVVIVDGCYGLRITDIAQPEQRLKSVQT